MATVPRRGQSDRPAILGGEPAFPERLTFVRPAVPDAESVLQDVREILDSRMLTNGRFVKELEVRTAEYLGVRHCIAVASCTSGLMLVLRASDLSGDVICPSFTFVATAHAIAWNGMRPVFGDVDLRTLTLSAEDVADHIGIRTSAILATHTFGTPCNVEGLRQTARRNGIRLFFDAAHAFGSRYQGNMVGGFGDAEVFSLSPTKVLVAGEGGIIATNDDLLAERCRIGRDYANPGDYDSRFVGLNARMSEFHAAVALRSLDGLDVRIDRRNELAARYVKALSDVPGISFPEVPSECRSTFKDFSVLVEPSQFGIHATRLAEALDAEGIETKRYYAPPVHQQRAYRSLAGSNGRLPATDWASDRVLTLPLWSEMSEDQVVRVAGSVARIQSVLSRQAQTAGDEGPFGSVDGNDKVRSDRFEDSVASGSGRAELGPGDEQHGE